MEDPEVTECIKTGVDEAKSNDDKGRCRVFYGNRECGDSLVH